LKNIFNKDSTELKLNSQADEFKLGHLVTIDSEQFSTISYQRIKAAFQLPFTVHQHQFSRIIEVG
jgi:hypothetical protein